MNGSFAWMAISATVIANIIGRRARRKSSPNIRHSEQMTSANIVQSSERVFPMPKGSGKFIDKKSNVIHFSIP